MAIFVKDPVASIDYAIDWSAGYLTGQVVTSSVWQIAPADDGGVTVVASSFDEARTTVTLAGGRPGYVYHIVNGVGFSDGRQDERTLILRVEDR